jgi:hypothetical protein
MKEFTRRGGNLVIKDAEAHDIEGYSKSHDLVLIAAGKGEISRLFERDGEKSPYDQPMSFANRSADCPRADWHLAWAMWLPPTTQSRVKAPYGLRV